MVDAVKNGKTSETSCIPAATIILIQQHSAEFQVYLLKRSPQSRFMAGNYVFPGGVIEEGDRNLEFWARHSDQDFIEGPACLGLEMPVTEAMACRIAAIRETFEEAGILLIQQNTHLSDDLAQVCEMRRDQDLTAGWLKREVQQHGWILLISALKRWAHWITPALMPRRYDTRFFMAAMPTGQVCRPDNREMTHGVWVSPVEGLKANLTGAMPLSPPTLVTLHQLSAFSSSDEVSCAADKTNWGPALEPRLIPTEEGPVILEPWDPQYAEPDAAIDPTALSAGLVKAAGAPFSRLWLNSGIWYPVTVAM